MTDSTDSDTEEELQALRKEDSHGTRADPGPEQDFVDVLVSALDAADNGEATDTISAYDPTLAAVLGALDEDEQLEATFDRLRDSYDGNSGLEEPTKSAIIRLAVRVGLQEGAGDVMEDLEAAIRQRQEPTV